MPSTTYLSLGAFYGADRRRGASRERDYGLWWRGEGLQDPTYRAAWIEETGELYVMQHEGTRGGGHVAVLARINDRLDLERRLAGWQEVCGERGSFRWLLDRIAAWTNGPAPTPDAA